MDTIQIYTDNQLKNNNFFQQRRLIYSEPGLLAIKNKIEQVGLAKPDKKVLRIFHLKAKISLKHTIKGNSR